MRPARKPSAALKRRVCDDDEVMPPAKKRARPQLFSDPDSDDDEDVADVPKPKAPSGIIRRIWAVKSKQEPHVAATSIKEALHVGERYDVIDIQEINTCFGPRQVWSLKGVEDASLKKVFGCTDLQQFTIDAEGYLDQKHRRDMIENVRVTFKGILETGNDTYPKYDFDYRQRQR